MQVFWTLSLTFKILFSETLTWIMCKILMFLFGRLWARVQMKSFESNASLICRTFLQALSHMHLLVPPGMSPTHLLVQVLKSQCATQSQVTHVQLWAQDRGLLLHGSLFPLTPVRLFSSPKDLHVAHLPESWSFMCLHFLRWPECLAEGQADTHGENSEWLYSIPWDCSSFLRVLGA